MKNYNIQNLKYNLEDYLQRCGVDTHKAKFKCAICGDKDGANFVPNTNRTVWKCFSVKHLGYTRNSGDIFDYVQQLNNVDFKGACSILNDIYFNGCEVVSKINNAPKEDRKSQKNYVGLYNRALQNQYNAVDYLKSRGLIHADEIAKEFQIGYIQNYAYEFKNNKPSKTTPVVIIPLSDYSYSWRSTIDNIKKKNGTIYPLNLKCLQNNAIKWIFLVEGEYDMFSILDITKDIPNCDFSAICLSSAVNLEKFIDVYISKNIQADTGLIIALDNDKNPNDSIKQATQKGLLMAKKHKISCVVADVKKLYLNQKDSNDALKYNREEFRNALINEVRKASTYNFENNEHLENQLPNNLPKWMSKLRYNRSGQLVRTQYNLTCILTNDEEFKQNIRYNEFTNMIDFRQNALTDYIESTITYRLDDVYGFVSSNDIFRKSLIQVAYNNSYHPVKQYIECLKWDGTSRLFTMFSDFLGCEDTLYTRECALILCMEMIDRVFNSGNKADYTITLVGSQGIGKSKFFSKLCLNQSWFTDSISSFESNFFELLRGKWLIELGEGTVFQKSTKEKVKQILTSQVDTFRKPYAHNSEDFKRQCVFVATTNNYNFLTDETGDRRFLPVDCDATKVTKSIDTDMTLEYVQQIFAEAYLLYKREKHLYPTNDDIKKEIERQQKLHFDASPIQNDLENYLEIEVPNFWYSMSISDRRYYINCYNKNDWESIYRFSSLGQDFKNTTYFKRGYISVREICCELYEYSTTQRIERVVSNDISRSLTALGWKRNNISKRISPYGVLKTFVR